MFVMMLVRSAAVLIVNSSGRACQEIFYASGYSPLRIPNTLSLRRIAWHGSETGSLPHLFSTAQNLNSLQRGTSEIVYMPKSGDSEENCLTEGPSKHRSCSQHFRRIR